MYFECVWLLYRRFFDCFSVICNKTFYKVYTVFSHTHLTTLSQLLAVGGVTTPIETVARDTYSFHQANNWRFCIAGRRHPKYAVCVCCVTPDTSYIAGYALSLLSNFAIK